MSRQPAVAPRSILVGLGETAGYCARLAAGFRAIGLRAEHLNLAGDPLGYSAESGGRAVRLARRLAHRRRSGARPRALWIGLHRLSMAWLLAAAIARHDAFVLRAGDSFLGMRDLGILRRLGKRVVVVFFGSDSRPSYLNGAEMARGLSGADAAAQTAAKRRLVERTERDASAVVCHAMSAQLHRRRSVAFLAIGIPREISPRDSSPPNSGPVRVLHAPSRLQGKGTDAVRGAVDAARRAGIEVELEILTGIPNREVLAALRRCDFVIDQVYSDTPMGGFAAEAAGAGRPAIVGGYGWDELRRLTPPEMLPPSHLCHPDELPDAVIRLARDAEYRVELGALARAFIESRWTPAAVAGRMARVLAGDAPAEWWFEPEEVGYLHGAGQDAEQLRAAVTAVLDAAGPAGLALSAPTDLELRLLELAGR